MHAIPKVFASNWPTTGRLTIPRQPIKASDGCNKMFHWPKKVDEGSSWGGDILNSDARHSMIPFVFGILFWLCSLAAAQVASFRCDMMYTAQERSASDPALKAPTLRTFEYTNPNSGTKGVVCLTLADETLAMFYLEEEAAASVFGSRKMAVGWAKQSADGSAYRGRLFPLQGESDQNTASNNNDSSPSAALSPSTAFSLSLSSSGDAITFTSTSSGATLIWNSRDDTGIPGWRMLSSPPVGCGPGLVQMNISDAMPTLQSGRSGVVCLDPTHLASNGKPGVVGYFSAGLRPVFRDLGRLVPFLDFGVLESLAPLYQNVYRGSVLDFVFAAPNQLAGFERRNPKRITAVRSASNLGVMLYGDVREQWTRPGQDENANQPGAYVILGQGSVNNLYGLGNISPSPQFQ
jgi:hypothetical protein